ncbi:MAG: hypothetical protein AAGU21_11840 [Solidesulfovibrio sp.]|uniref:hypothetical protein n=1 Tax=Solidesulfovibrio sp. TaxID=2910990 RepID=UPI003158AF21
MTEFIKAIASIMWPIGVFATFWYFRNELKDILKRLKKGRAFGAEVELNEAIVSLGESVEVVSSAISEGVPSVVESSGEICGSQPYKTKHITLEGVQLQKATLLRVSLEMESLVKYIAATEGMLESGKAALFDNIVELLAKKSVLSDQLMLTIKSFINIKNRILHENFSNRNIEGEIVKLVDIGNNIIEGLKSIPYIIHRVYNPSLELFSTADCKTLRENVVGVMIEYIDRVNKKKFYGVFPTTRQYRIGQEVSLEWNLAVAVGETWYKHPDTKEIKLGWLGHCEFAGRDIEELLMLA